MSGLLDTFFVPVGATVTHSPGFLIRGVRIDNPTGNWYALNGTYIVPPSIQAWTADLPVGTQSVTLGPTNFGGQPQLTTPGDQLTVTLYDEPIGISPGAPFLVIDNRSAPASVVVSSVAAQTLTISGFFAVGLRVDNPMQIAWSLPDGSIIPAYTLGWTHDLLPPWKSVTFTPTTDPRGYTNTATGATLSIQAYAVKVGEFGGTFTAGQSLPHGQAAFTASGSWVCPAAVTQVAVLLVGGGGGGGGVAASTYGAAGGGGGGAVIQRDVPVTPGTSYTITIGAGGAGGTLGGNGAQGGTSSFGTLLSAPGGGGGGGAGTAGAGLSGTTGAGGGGAGYNSNSSVTYVCGGGGGGSGGTGGTGAGNPSVLVGSAGNPGFSGGSAISGSATAVTGGAGGNGTLGYGGGGGGGSMVANAQGLGSQGGGNGAAGTASGGAAAANSGSGGGGAANASSAAVDQTGGAGGSGYCLISW